MAANSQALSPKVYQALKSLDLRSFLSLEWVCLQKPSDTMNIFAIWVIFSTGIAECPNFNVRVDLTFVWRYYSGFL